MSSTAVLFGGPSPEHDISILTGLQAARILSGAGHEVVPVYWAKSGAFVRAADDAEAADFVSGPPSNAAALELVLAEGFVERRRGRSRALDVDVVFNCCHGGAGEDGTVSGLLTVAGLHVTGPSAAGCALAMDKLATTALAESIGIATIPTARLDDATESIPFDAPWVVKPRYGGSSLGVEVGIEDLETARALTRTGVARGGAVVQPYLAGWQDLNIAVRTTPALEVSAIERPLAAGDRIYDYRSKYLEGAGGMESAKRELPAVIPDGVERTIRDTAQRLARAMGLSGLPRIDYLWDGADEVRLCEVNSIPGALGLYLWQASGLDRARVLADVVEEARRTTVPAHWASSTDGAALRAAGTVASKLV